MYHTNTWRKLRVSILRSNPLCVRCKNAGVIKIASVIDHCIPSREYKGDFFDTDNLFPVCVKCHSDITKNFDNKNAHRVKELAEDYPKYKYSNAEHRRGDNGFLIDSKLSGILDSLEVVGTKDTPLSSNKM